MASQQLYDGEGIHSERKIAEEALWESQEWLQDFLDNANDLIQSVAPDGRLLYVNQKWRETLGYTEGEIAGLSLFDIIHPDSLAHCKEVFQRVIAGERVNHIEAKFVAKDGGVIMVEGSANCRFEDGKPIATRGIFRDITERKIAEEALWESEQRYRLLADNVTDVIWTMNMDLRFTYLSASITRQIGYSVEEAMALSLEEILTSASAEIARKAFTEEIAIENMEQKDLSKSRTLELEQCCKDGSTIWTELEVTFLRDSNGNANGILGVSRDITQRKMAEEEKLRAVTEKAAVLDSMGEGLLIMGMEGKVISCNPAFERLCGYTEGDLIGKDAAGLINIIVKSEDRERLLLNVAATLTAGIAGTEYFTLISGDGREIPVATTETLVVDEEGNPTTIIAVFKDITDIRQAETALRESEEKLRSFMDSATDFFTIWDSELNMIDLNEASLSYPTIRHPDGAKKEDFIGRNILDLDPDIKERGRYDQYLEVIRTGKPLFFDDVVRRPKIGDVRLSVRAFKVGDGLGLLTMDMTEYKRTDEMLRQAEKLRALGEMAGGVAHDFNNILSVVLGRAQLALADVKDEKARRSIQIIEQTALDAAVMVRRLREVAVVSGDRAFDEINLNQLMEDAMQMVESRRLELEETAGVTIDIHTKCNEVSPAAGDAAELREALVNILFNAMDAMPEGGNITMESRQEDSRVVISISDTGTGIPEEIRGKLFDPFFSTKASKGSGLGLSVTMGIITKHGGSIDVESTQGEGTTFHIRLPIANCIAEESRPKSKPPIVKRARILLVDDDPEVSDIIGLTLEHLGHRVTVATSGGEALSAFKRNDYGLVITDLGMPDVSGIDVARAVKATKPNTPVMLITGWGVQLDSEQMRDIDGLIEKPFGKDALLAHIAELLPVRNGVKA